MKKQVTDRLVILTFLLAPFTWMACGNNEGGNAAGADTAGREETDTATTVAEGGPLAVAALSGTKQDTTVNGTVRFTQDGNKIKMDLEIIVPAKANQSVAVHIHEHSGCGDMGKHAGGHWNPTSENHGKWGEGAFHSGDIGNIDLDGEGKGTVEVSSNRWTIGGDAKTDILNKSIIVHSGVDDYKSQPAGASGERIGCGVIQRGNSSATGNQH